MISTQTTILVTSNEPWGDMWFSKQNYAYELSKTHRVYFINPPQKWTLRQFVQPYLEVKSYTDNLKIIDYYSFLPVRTPWLNRQNNALCSKLIRQYLQSQGHQDLLLWAFDPTRLYDPQALGCQQSVFHCVDHYYFKYLGETELCQRVDAIFATSQTYLDNYQAFDKPKYIVPHGISLEEFDCPPAQAPKDLPDFPYGLYVGSIDWRMDYDLMERMIQRYPAQQFVFIGALKDAQSEAQNRIFRQKKYPNVHYLGTRHYKTLKYYTQKANFCLFLINFNLHFSSVHQHKTLGYLAQGKPVFGMRSYEYQNQKQLMYLGEDEAELLAYMDQFFAHGESPDLAAPRQAYARQYTFDQILARAKGLLP
jgi:glycosyltransferase involved in cell wall biosynthesis